jgi:hypothetical protein
MGSPFFIKKRKMSKEILRAPAPAGLLGFCRGVAAPNGY